MGNSKTDVRNAPDDVSKPLPYEERTSPEKSILEQNAQFSGLFNTWDLTLVKQQQSLFVMSVLEKLYLLILKA